MLVRFGLRGNPPRPATPPAARAFQAGQASVIFPSSDRERACAAPPGSAGQAAPAALPLALLLLVPLALALVVVTVVLALALALVVLVAPAGLHYDAAP